MFIVPVYSRNISAITWLYPTPRSSTPSSHYTRLQGAKAGRLYLRYNQQRFISTHIHIIRLVSMTTRTSCQIYWPHFCTCIVFLFGTAQRLLCRMHSHLNMQRLIYTTSHLSTNADIDVDRLNAFYTTVSQF